MIPLTIKEFLRDYKVFGITASVKAFGHDRGSGMLELDLPKFGRISVRRGDTDYGTVRQVFRKREYAFGNAIVESKIFVRYQAILAQGKTPVIIDAGANIGAASIWFSLMFPDAWIVAIEPDPENARMLRHNCAAHSRVSVVEAAIGAEAGHVNIINEGASWGVKTERSDAGCPIMTVEEAVALVPNGVDFIAKIDIEGFEKDLFSTNLDWIDHMAAIFVEPHDWLFTGTGTSGNFQRAMGARNFELFVRGENLFYVNSVVLA